MFLGYPSIHYLVALPKIVVTFLSFTYQDSNLLRQDLMLRTLHLCYQRIILRKFKTYIIGEHINIMGIVSVFSIFLRTVGRIQTFFSQNHLHPKGNHPAKFQLISEDLTNKQTKTHTNSLISDCFRG